MGRCLSAFLRIRGGVIRGISDSGKGPGDPLGAQARLEGQIAVQYIRAGHKLCGKWAVSLERGFKIRQRAFQRQAQLFITHGINQGLGIERGAQGILVLQGDLRHEIGVHITGIDLETRERDVMPFRLERQR